MSLTIIVKQDPVKPICHVRRNDWPKDYSVEVPTAQMMAVKFTLKVLDITLVEAKP